MGANLRVEVATEDLLALVRERRAERVAKFTKEESDYAARLAAWQKKAAKALRAAADKVERGEEVDESTWRRTPSITVEVRAARPSEPELTVDEIDKDIKVLELAAKPTLVITANDHFARYL